MTRIYLLAAIALFICMCTLSMCAQDWIKEPTYEHPGEWTISGEVEVAPGNLTRSAQPELSHCKDRREETSLRFSILLGQATNAKIFDSLTAFRTSGGFLNGKDVSALLGEVAKFNADVAGDDSKKEIQKNGKDFADYLDQLGISRKATGCATIALILPWGTMKIGKPKYYAAEDTQQPGVPLKFKECQTGDAGMATCFMGQLSVTMYRDQYSLAYIFVVKNSSTDRTRHLRVSMPFTPALGYVPPDYPPIPENKNAGSATSGR
jgi:hypothetical protein